MARPAKKTYYWDTCCFIAWITAKGHPNEVLDGLDDVAKEVTENRAALFTSVITETEILEGKLTPDEISRFQNLFKRRNVNQITLDQRIARRASEIRSYYSQRGIKIKTPDAQHLATALIYGADEFHTLDGGGERQRPSDLLRLNGDVAGFPLHIRKPLTKMPPLLEIAAAAESESVKSAKNGGTVGTEENAKGAKLSPAEIQGSDDRHTEGQGAEGATTQEKKVEGPPSL